MRYVPIARRARLSPDCPADPRCPRGPARGLFLCLKTPLRAPKQAWQNRPPYACWPLDGKSRIPTGSKRKPNAPDQKTAGRVAANFARVVKTGDLRLHPQIGGLVEKERLEKMGGSRLAQPEGGQN